MAVQALWRCDRLGCSVRRETPGDATPHGWTSVQVEGFEEAVFCPEHSKELHAVLGTLVTLQEGEARRPGAGLAPMGPLVVPFHPMPPGIELVPDLSPRGAR